MSRNADSENRENSKELTKRRSRSSNNKQEGGKKKHIHVVFGAERYNKFKTIKTKLVQSSDVDVLRLCVDKVFDSLGEEAIVLRPLLKQKLEFFLGNEYLKDRHLILNMNDIINEAIHHWIQNKRSELNLHHFPFRKELPEMEQRVALVFVEKQLDYERGLTLENLMSHLEGLDKKQVKQILQKFIVNGLVITNTFEGTDYYYAVVS